MCQCLLSLCFLVACGAPEIKSTDLEGFVKDFEKVELELLAKLKEKNLWQDSTQQSKLLVYLQAAAKVRSKSLVPLLVDHISYSPYSEDEAKRIALVKRFPVMAVLADTGTSSVQALLNLLTKTDPNDLKTGGQQKHTLAIICLRSIYGGDMYGAPLAKQRIELEFKKALGKEKALLKEALEHPALKE